MALSSEKVIATVEKLNERLVKAKLRVLRAADAHAVASQAEASLIAELRMYHAHPAVIEAAGSGVLRNVEEQMQHADLLANERRVEETAPSPITYGTPTDGA
jgi:hypothetical protein